MVAVRADRATTVRSTPLRADRLRGSGRVRAALVGHDRRRHGLFDELNRAHQNQVAEQRRAHEASWDATAAAVASADADAVSNLAGVILQASPALHGLLDGGRATYEAPERELVLEIDLPDTDVIPTDRAWKYVVGRKAVEPVKRSPTTQPTSTPR